MAITQRFALNAAVQYNEVDMTDYLVSDATTGKKFLTEAALTRIIKETESVALYYACNDTTFNAMGNWKFYDETGSLIYDFLIELLGSETQNAIPVNIVDYIPTSSAAKVTFQIIGLDNLLNNPEFLLTSGTNDFSNWTEDTSGGTITAANLGFGNKQAIRFTTTSGTCSIQQKGLTLGANYTCVFYAKEASAGSHTLVFQDILGGTVYDTINITTNTFDKYTFNFTSADDDFTIELQSGDVIIDRVYIFLQSDVAEELTEMRTYLYDTSCADNEIELNWLNKLGGRDSWVFTGFPIEERNVNRITPIEYAKVTNLTAPNRVYANRQNVSRKGYTIAHRCGDRTTAVWLKEELMDSIDVMMKVGSEYYPVQVTNGTMTTNDTFSQDYTVRFNILEAFDINIQTR